MRIILVLAVLLGLHIVSAHPYGPDKGKKQMTKETKEKMKKHYHGGDLDGHKQKLDKMRTALSKKNKGRSALLPGDDIFLINSNAGVADYFFDGDMDLTEGQIRYMEAETIFDDEVTRQKRQMTTVFGKWYYGLVYFYFDDDISQRTRNIVAAAHKKISAGTCISFSEDPDAEDVIRVVNGSWCSSFVGMIGGVQKLALHDDCTVIGTVAHEFTHALGSFHEHERYDRDDYVTVDMSRADGNYEKMRTLNTVNHVPYEYGSMMHYPRTSVMVPKDDKYLFTMGHRQITFYDLLSINKQYGCDVLCNSSNSAVCQNGGYPNPRNCATCNCPSGYGGALCNQRPQGFDGMAHNATTSWQQFNSTVGFMDNIIRDDFTSRVDWITAPEGTTIEVGLTGKVSGNTCQYTCNINGVELKVAADQGASGLMFCCPQSTSETWRSELNPTPIITYNRQGMSSYTIRYRFVEDPTKTTTTQQVTTTQLPTTTAEPPKTTTTVPVEVTTTTANPNPPCGPVTNSTPTEGSTSTTAVTKPPITTVEPNLCATCKPLKIVKPKKSKTLTMSSPSATLNDVGCLVQEIECTTRNTSMEAVVTVKGWSLTISMNGAMSVECDNGNWKYVLPSGKTYEGILEASCSEALPKWPRAPGIL